VKGEAVQTTEALLGELPASRRRCTCGQFTTTMSVAGAPLSAVVADGQMEGECHITADEV